MVDVDRARLKPMAEGTEEEEEEVEAVGAEEDISLRGLSAVQVL